MAAEVKAPLSSGCMKGNNTEDERSRKVEIQLTCDKA